ncbi:PAS domain-containing sensor histidine kinase [Paucibacter soli]|uniref:PAS domain-containing sensor histidine kinase n=1 Tax=Paucibacter soli TaxID=3133433 RepID=UPI00309B9639
MHPASTRSMQALARRLVFDALPQPLAMVRLADDGVVDANPALLQLLGLPREQVLGQRLDALGLPGSQLLLKASEPLELRHAAPDGREQWLLWSASGLDGEGTLLLVSGTDISARKREELDLRRSERSFFALFDAAPLPMSYSPLRPGLGESFWNQAWYQAFGYAPGSKEGQGGNRFGFWLEPAERQRYAEDLLRSPEVLEREVRLRHADGSVRDCLLSGRYVEVGGDRKVLTSYRDITELLRAQRALQELNQSLEMRVQARTQELVRSEKLAALGSLVAGVAHELNTPIGNALLMASTLADQRSGFELALQAGLRKSQLQQFLGELAAGTELLLHSLERASKLIVSFKQVAVSQSDYQRREFALAAVVHETSLSLLPTLRPRGITLDQRVDARLQLDSYPGPLVQLLIGLVTNAAQHGFPEGGPGHISIEAEAAGPEALTLWVRDNGVGMSAAHLARAFDPFFTTKLGQGGSGLGLHIAYNLVTGLLGGQIALSSTPGQGLSVELRLPRCAPPGPPHA